MNHLTSEQIEEVIVGKQSDEVEMHLRRCPECEERVHIVKKMERLLRSIPLERVDPEFTQRVLRNIGIIPPPSLMWTILKNVAPMAALVSVVGISVATLRYFGVFQGTHLQESASGMQSVYDHLTGPIAGSVAALNAWLAKYVSFAFAKTSYGLTSFLVSFFAVVALLDKYVLKPKLRRKL